MVVIVAEESPLDDAPTATRLSETAWFNAVLDSCVAASRG